MKIITAQFGARHNYAIPAAVANHGLLDRFYTDICGQKGIGRLATFAKQIGLSNTSVSALAYRRPPREVIERTKTFDCFGLKLRSALNRANPLESIKIWDEAAIVFGKLIASDGLSDIDVLYGVMHEVGPLYRRARELGIKTAADVCITPSWERLVLDEQKKFPTWSVPQPSFAKALGSENEPYRHMFGQLDCWICPSEFVRQDLVENFGVSGDETVVVPYAVSNHWFDIQPSPRKGRILFVGTANLRKGIHHLAAAAEILKKEGDHYEFRVAGAVSDSIRNRNETRYLKFLGQISREQIHNEFRQADVFVLPSIAEGSAGVVYEALAAGIPIVTTYAAGSVVKNGEEGFVLHTANATDLAESISQIVADRFLRTNMAIQARKTAIRYSWPNFEDCLITSLVSLLRPPVQSNDMS